MEEEVDMASVAKTLEYPLATMKLVVGVPAVDVHYLDGPDAR